MTDELKKAETKKKRQANMAKARAGKVKKAAEAAAIFSGANNPPVDDDIDQRGAEVKADEFDRKIDHLTYDADDRERDVYAHSEDSILSVPPEIKKANPGMTFHWVSKSNLDRRGKGYQGWKLVEDADHPNGVCRGGDSFLAYKPNDLAEAQRKRNQDASTQAVKDVSEGHMAMMEKAVADSDGLLEIMVPGETLPNDPTKRKIGAGGAVGVRGQFGRGKPFQRGRGAVSNEEIRERFIKAKEERDKNKTIFT